MNIIDYSGKRIIFDKHSFVSLLKKEANKVLIGFEVYYNDNITSFQIFHDTEFAVFSIIKKNETDNVWTEQIRIIKGKHGFLGTSAIAQVQNLLQIEFDFPKPNRHEISLKLNDDSHYLISVFSPDFSYMEAGVVIPDENKYANIDWKIKDLTKEVYYNELKNEDLCDETDADADGDKSYPVFGVAKQE